jgi:hypothetical protein
MAIAPVLKTGVRKGMGVRIPLSPPPFYLLPGVADLVAYIGFEGIDARIDLPPLQYRAFYLAAVAVEDRQRNAEEEAERVASARHSMLSAVFGADRVINFSLRDLQPDFGQRARLIASKRLQIGTQTERQPLGFTSKLAGGSRRGSSMTSKSAAGTARPISSCNRSLASRSFVCACSALFCNCRAATSVRRSSTQPPDGAEAQARSSPASARRVSGNAYR